MHTWIWQPISRYDLTGCTCKKVECEFKILLSIVRVPFISFSILYHFIEQNQRTWFYVTLFSFNKNFILFPCLVICLLLWHTWLFFNAKLTYLSRENREMPQSSNATCCSMSKIQIWYFLLIFASKYKNFICKK